MGYYRETNRDRTNGNMKLRKSTIVWIKKIHYLEKQGKTIQVRNAARWVHYYWRTARMCQAADLPELVRDYMLRVKVELRFLHSLAGDIL